MTVEIEKLVEWSEPRRVTTRQGDRMLRTAKVTEDFWKAWRAGKTALKEAGVSCQPVPGSQDWQACWWLPVDPEQAAAERTAKEAAASASRALDADVELPKPDGLEYLGYQRAGVVFALDCLKSGRGCLIADEMGLGKTIQAIGIINATPDIKRVLVICPNTLKLNWRRELVKWLVRPLLVGIQNAGQTYIGDHCDILIINFDVVHKFVERLAAGNWDLKVIDEAHYIKNTKARRTKAALSIPARRKVSLTGTPIENRPVELWPIIADLHPEKWHPKKGFFRFAQKFCAAHHNGFGWDFGGASNLPELQLELRGSIMVRRLKADVLTELPPKRRQVIELERDATADDVIEREMSEYVRREDMLATLRARVEIAKASDRREDYERAVTALREGQGAVFAEMAELRHDVGMAKLPQAIAFIQDALEGGKVLVFCHHLAVVAGLKQAFPQAAIITGETATDRRMGEVDRFQKDPACNVFIGNNAAAEGLTLTAGAHVIFVELDWVPGKLAQKEDRAHRIGQRDSVLCSYLVFEGSLDAVMAKSCVSKLSVIDTALDKEAPLEPLPEVELKVKPVTSVTLPEQTFESIAKASLTVNPELAALALQGMRLLAGVCDGAVRIDGAGFSKVDMAIGHSFAGQSKLTPKQAALAARLCVKYRRQLGSLAERVHELMKEGK